MIVYFSSLELVGELFAMPMDPDGSSEEASQKSSSCSKGTGDGPKPGYKSQKMITIFAGAQVTDCKF